MATTIEIDGKTLETEPGKMIIEVADEAGIRIPRFCYHKKLSVAANCRMCLVEVEKSRKPLPACATPVTDGMKVFTQSEMALKAQKVVMEFLLINHPLDCPICDQGGECELQDVSMGYGDDVSRYNEGKRVVDDEDIGPLISTDMTRCIHCTRCVRFGEEVAGLRELGATGRGENMRIGTFIKHSIKSEVSGNVIDLCPVGALTSKPYRFTARAWELAQHATIAPHDCIGSNIYVHTRRGEVMRVVPKENEDVNETWISDRDRYAYTGLRSKERVRTPMIKAHGQWQETDWATALNVAVKGLKRVINEVGPEQVASIASANSTLEELYLLQKLMRSQGCENIDHRTHQIDFADQDTAGLFPGSSMAYADLEKQQAILLVGSNVQAEQPVAGIRVRKAALDGAKVMAVNSIDYDFHFDVAEKMIASPNELVMRLAEIAKAVDKENNALLSNVTVSETAQNIANQLQQAPATIILGAIAQNHPQAATVRSLAESIAKACSANVIVMTEGSNSAGAWIAGAIPHRTTGGVKVSKPGLTAADMFAKQCRAYVLMNIEPELDCEQPQKVMEAMKKADFIVAMNTFSSGMMLEYADVILPIAAFSETAGTYVNVEGRWQQFNGSCNPFEEARPAWKVLRVLGNLFEVEGFDYESAEQVHDEIKAIVDASPAVIATKHQPKTLATSTSKLQRIAYWPIYRGDGMTRRAQPLQQSATSELFVVRMNTHTGKLFNVINNDTVMVRQGDVSHQMPLVIDNRVADNCAVLVNGFVDSINFADSFGELEIK